MATIKSTRKKPWEKLGVVTEADLEAAESGNHLICLLQGIKGEAAMTRFGIVMRNKFDSGERFVFCPCESGARGNGWTGDFLKTINCDSWERWRLNDPTMLPELMIHIKNNNY